MSDSLVSSSSSSAPALAIGGAAGQAGGLATEQPADGNDGMSAVFLGLKAEIGKQVAELVRHEAAAACEPARSLRSSEKKSRPTKRAASGSAGPATQEDDTELQGDLRPSELQQATGQFRMHSVQGQRAAPRAVAARRT
eukprot:gene356-11158_t